MKDKIVLFSVIVIYVLISGCNVGNSEEKGGQQVEYFYIKFTDYIINMSLPTDTVGVENFSFTKLLFNN